MDVEKLPEDDDDSMNLSKIMELAGTFGTSDSTSSLSKAQSSDTANNCDVMIEKEEKEESAKLIEPVSSEEFTSIQPTGFTSGVSSGGKGHFKAFYYR